MPTSSSAPTSTKLPTSEKGEVTSNPNYIDYSKISKLLRKPGIVRQVQFHGIKRTNEQFLHTLVRPLFECSNIDEMFTTSCFVRDRLFEDTRAFKDVDVVIDIYRPTAASASGSTTVASASQTGQEMEKISYEVHFNVTEESRIRGGIGISAPVNTPRPTPQLDLQAWLPNLFGRGERLDLNLQHGVGSAGVDGLSFDLFKSGSSTSTNGTAAAAQGNASRYLTFTKPFAHNFLGLGNSGATLLSGTPKGCEFQASVSRLDSDLQWFRLHSQETGGQASINFPSYGRLGLNGVRHSLGISSYRRHLGTMSVESTNANFTPISMRQFCGPHWKNSLLHAIHYDTNAKAGRARSLAEQMLPQKTGLAVDFKQEFEPSWLGGQLEQSKHEATTSLSFALPFGASLQATAAGGVLVASPGSEKRNLADRFLMGGPLNLRGFEIGGAGPQLAYDPTESESSSATVPKASSPQEFSPSSCTLGGNTYWFAGLHLYTPIPYVSRIFSDALRLHGFATCGSLGQLDMAQLLGSRRRVGLLESVGGARPPGPDWGAAGDQMRQLALSYRASVGLGLAIRIGSIARLELNYAMPVQTRPGDRFTQGLQVGLGVQFL